MKKTLLSLFLLLSCLNADEIARIESIVNDITTLRTSYEKSQEDLELCRVTLKDEKEKSVILKRELDSDVPISKKEKDYKNKIKNLENKIKELQNRLKSKESIYKKEDTNNLNNQIKDENKFPNLQMRKEFLDLETIEYFPASSFRVNKDASIYDAMNGNEIAKWEENTSFTSNQKTQHWIKITGYFVDRVWQKSTSEMWLKLEDSKQRDK